MLLRASLRRAITESLVKLTRGKEKLLNATDSQQTSTKSRKATVVFGGAEGVMLLLAPGSCMLFVL